MSALCRLFGHRHDGPCACCTRKCGLLCVFHLQELREVQR